MGFKYKITVHIETKENLETKLLSRDDLPNYAWESTKAIKVITDAVSGFCHDICSDADISIEDWRYDWEDGRSEKEKGKEAFRKRIRDHNNRLRLERENDDDIS